MDRTHMSRRDRTFSIVFWLGFFGLNFGQTIFD